MLHIVFYMDSMIKKVMNIRQGLFIQFIKGGNDVVIEINEGDSVGWQTISKN